MTRSARLRAWLLGFLIVMPGLAWSQVCEPPAARVISAQGSVQAQRAGQAGWAAVQLDDRLCAGDALRVQRASRAALALPDQTVVRLDQDSSITFPPPRDDKQTWIELLQGLLHVISRDPRALRVVTPFADAGIDGTEFLVTVTQREATVLVLEGQVTVNAIAGGSATARSGEQVTAAAGKPPVTAVVVRPRDAVQWTLYYPPVNSRGATPGTAVAGQGDAATLVSEAGRDLTLGRVDDAHEKLNRVEAIEPQNAEALALRSIVALTQNDKEAARALADRSVAADPRSATALIARSYVQQAYFDLPGALRSLQAAVALEPGNALAQARLAELWLSVGDAKAAVTAANLAVAADPALALPHTVLGFADLARVDITRARAAFEDAIRLDSAAPLPRLGLGLAKIRAGDLAGGREEIEIAVILDPNNALIRSYMGKTYYEEKRDKLAAGQLDTAKSLDPLDPTAFFYDAIRKQTVNRPVEALQDLQKSIDLNGNRAVYRSRLQLDEDLAARSAAIGRTYRDLGFQELALREGWKSVSVDPADYSGHRLLADSYSALPRHEIARVSELFQSQLLQPLNITPVQSQLAEANLFILDAAGPADISFNEFNPLFSRDRLAVQSSAVVANRGTWGVDGTIAGIDGPWSASVGGYHFETDGFQANNGLRQSIGNAFVQYRYSDATTLLGEVRTAARLEGSLPIVVRPFSTTSVTDDDSTSVRIGARHDFGVRTTILGTFGYQRASISLFAPEPDSPRINDDTDTYTAELQLIRRGASGSLTIGARYLGSTIDEYDRFVVPLPDPPFQQVFESRATRRPQDVSVYIYQTLALPAHFLVTLGASADFVHGNTFNRDRLNPKFGVVWQPTVNTTVRISAFQTLQRLELSRIDIQPSLEPTPVAGFNQFFFGSEAEEARRVGLAVDHRLSEFAATGLEVSARRLNLPFFEQTPPPDVQLRVVSTHVTEKQARTYIYWWPSPEVSVSAGYQYDLFNNAANFFPFGYRTLETHRIPLRVAYSHPAGFAASFEATPVWQRGQFADFGPFPSFSGEASHFWVADASASYRLPKRWGIVRLEAKNLFDRRIHFQDVDPENPRIVPERLIMFRMTVAY